MITSNSVRYMVRLPMKDSGEPVTIRELKDFLDRLIMGRCGSFKVITSGGDESCAVNAKPTHYTLNGHNSTVTID